MSKKGNRKYRPPRNPIVDYLAKHQRKALDGTVFSSPVVTIQLPTPEIVVHHLSQFLIRHNLIAQA